MSRALTGDCGRRLRLAAPGLALACALAAAFTGAGCGQSHSLAPAGQTGEMPDQEVTDFALTETDAGIPQWKLYARYAATYDVRNQVLVRAIRVDFFDDKGQASSSLTAREGDLQQQTHDMTARGNVVLQTSEGTRMSTQEIRFMNREQKIVAPIDQMVRVERHGDVLTGYGFESDPDLRHFEFKRRVQATVRTQSGGGILQRESSPAPAARPAAPIAPATRPAAPASPAATPDTGAGT
ncbi:MAG TPA: LPS export ABC transporter periplasmic protein LptC [Candidatus Eisenbacteria bacterium]|nr:LPS export ABC transporter periplasmic protein LptC [Candidatus Eisenbacteria bacterium]